jgi:hypothetical protein
MKRYGLLTMLRSLQRIGKNEGPKIPVISTSITAEIYLPPNISTLGHLK